MGSWARAVLGRADHRWRRLRPQSRRRISAVAAAAVPVLVGVLVWSQLRPFAGAPTQAGPSSVSTSASASASASAAAVSSSASSGGNGRGSLAAQDAAVPAQEQRPLIGTYLVQKGDNLTVIAGRLGTDVATLEKINGLNNYSVLQIGEKLTVIYQVGYLYTVKSGDTLGAIAAATGVSAVRLADANELSGSGATLIAGARLIIPTEPHVTQPPPPPGAGAVGWPVRGPITSPFGWRVNPLPPPKYDFHYGIDIAVPMYTPVQAACSGTVILSRWDGGYGYAVEVRCTSGLVTLCAHNSKLEVWVGKWVTRGDLIAYSGMTGNATGPHVHFGVMVDGVWKNPLNYLP